MLIFEKSSIPAKWAGLFKKSAFIRENTGAQGDLDQAG
jgi:hypothetical protein